MTLDDPAITTWAISGALANRDQCAAIPYTPDEHAAETGDFVFQGVFSNPFDEIVAPRVGADEALPA